jgi:hypothetical protein
VEHSSTQLAESFKVDHHALQWPAQMSDQRICAAIASTLVQQDIDAGLSDAQVAEFLNLIETVRPGQAKLCMLPQSVS